MSETHDLPMNQIICGDCLEVMRGWPDDCVDLVLTDPPYGIGETGKKNNSRGRLAKTTDYGDFTWDKAKIPDKTMLVVIEISKNQIVFGGNYYGKLLGDTSCYIVWNKDNGSNDFADAELAWTSFTSAVRIVKWRWNGMLQEPNTQKEKRVHPTQKPLGVMKWILERYSKSDQLILDPFCGSGTTCIAAKMLGRRYIGIDISEEYCKIARERIKAVETGVPVKEARKGQMALFGESS